MVQKHNIPKRVETSQESQVAIIWNQEITINRTTPRKKPDITLRDRNGTCLQFVISIPTDRNLVKEEKQSQRICPRARVEPCPCC
jgi:hypothetical protein